MLDVSVGCQLREKTPQTGVYCLLGVSKKYIHVDASPCLHLLFGCTEIPESHLRKHEISKTYAYVQNPAAEFSERRPHALNTRAPIALVYMSHTCKL